MFLGAVRRFDEATVIDEPRRSAWLLRADACKQVPTPEP
jgi:hypothetical protein